MSLDKAISQLTQTTITGTDFTVIERNGTPNSNFKVPGSNFLLSANNLSDLTNFVLARKNLTASLITNSIYVNANAGSDTNGTGSAISPFASISHAITFAKANGISSANPFTAIIMGGQITDSAGQIIIPPYFNIKGESQQTIIRCTNNIILDTAAWTSTPNGASYFDDVSIFGTINFDGSSITATGVGILQFNDVFVSQSLKILGSSTFQAELFIYNSNITDLFCDNSTIQESCSNIYAAVSLGSASLIAANAINSLGDIITSFSGVSSSSTGTYKVSGCQSIASLILHGSNTHFYTDASSIYNVTPSLSAGAQIILLDEAANIFASSTRTNYTPTSPTVEGNFQGIDIALGNTAPGITLPNNAVALGTGGNSLKSQTGFNFNSILTVPVGIQVTNDSALPFVLMGDGTINNSPILAYNGPFGYFSNGNTGDGILRNGDSTKAWRIGVGTSNSQVSITNTQFQVGLLNSVGVVHTDSSGNFSTSLIVDADVNSSANITYSKINSSTLGVGYHLAAFTGSTITLTNPCPNFIELAGSTGTLQLPPMNQSNSLSISNNTFIAIYNSASGSIAIQTNTGATSYGNINPGQTFLLFPVDNSSADGHFVVTNVTSTTITATAPIAVSGNNVSLNSNGVTNTYLAQMPAFTIKGNTTGSTANAADLTVTNVLNLLGLNQPLNQVVYGNGSSGITSNSNFTYNGSGQLTLTQAGSGDLLILNDTNSSSTANQLSFQQSGTDKLSIGYNASASQSYIYSASTVLKFGTSSTEVGRFNGTTFQVAGLNSAGVVHTDSSGNFSTSQVVSADIQTNAVSNSNLAQMPANTIKGNNTGSTANAADLTITQLNTMLSRTSSVSSISTVGITVSYAFETWLFNNPASTPITVTLPLLSAGVPGMAIRIMKLAVNSSNTITVVPQGSDTILNGASFGVISQYTFVKMLNLGTNWVYIGNSG